MSAKFGPAGNCDSFSAKHKSSLDAPGWIRQFGLDCYEYQCGKGVRVSEEMAGTMKQRSEKNGITISLHAPYFINLANPAAESLEKNIGYVLAACRAVDAMGGRRVVVHSGTLMKRPRREALEIAKESLKRIVSACDDEGFGHITLCPETMGKTNQLGDLDEVLELCQMDERLVPCVDFGHLYARSLGVDEGREATARMLDKMQSALGEERARAFHSHFSMIEYTRPGGEKCHRTFDNNGGFGPNYKPLMEEIARRSWGPTIICESAGTQAEDARTMKQYYHSLG